MQHLMKSFLIVFAALIAWLPAQTRIQIQPECGTQHVIDDNHQIFFKLKAPDGTVHKIMVRLAHGLGDEGMALCISNAIDEATGQSTKVEEAPPGEPNPDKEDVVLEAGWTFVSGSLYKYKQVDETKDAWLNKTSGHVDVHVDNGSGYKDEPQQTDSRQTKTFSATPPNW